MPASLHPIIDPVRCIGCGACTHACPEGQVIRLVAGKAQLVDPSSCIGHGACKSSCPSGAIDLVFGSARRGVDIPVVSASFESSVPGIFIAGELGGMGLIANAIDQGRQAMEAIARLDGLGRKDVLDVVVVGAGPAGLSAGLMARQLGLRCAMLEQHSLGGTVAQYPRDKVVMSRPAHLPGYGRLFLKRMRKERLLAIWKAASDKAGMTVSYGVRVESIQSETDGFIVLTSRGTIRCRAVLLATGRRGAPRRLDVSGEDLPKVRHGLADPMQYRGKHVVVVGAGDSALEAVAHLHGSGAASIALCNRGDGFPRACAKNRRELQELVARGRVVVLYRTRVRAIEHACIQLERDGRLIVIANDAVVVCAGGVLPTELLSSAGISVERKYGKA